MYKCSICGKDYDNVKDRAECEIRCIHARVAAAKEAERRAKAEAEAARTKLANEIEADLKALRTKMQTYNDKYGLTYVLGCGGNNSNPVTLGEFLNAIFS